MPKFKYLIIPLEDGNITGTNNDQVALNAAAEEVVINVETGEVINLDGANEEIQEETQYQPV